CTTVPGYSSGWSHFDYW
nr:immunoglobulin heavy chain junction region [Macaca mulatta]